MYVQHKNLFVGGKFVADIQKEVEDLVGALVLVEVAYSKGIINQATYEAVMRKFGSEEVNLDACK